MIPHIISDIILSFIFYPLLSLLNVSHETIYLIQFNSYLYYIIPFPLSHLPIPYIYHLPFFHLSTHFPPSMHPTYTISILIPIPFPFPLVIAPNTSHLAINPISYHISYNIFCYPILSYHIPIPSYIVTITTHIVFNTTCNPTHIPYHVFNYYLISLSIYYVNSQVRLC